MQTDVLNVMLLQKFEWNRVSSLFSLGIDPDAGCHGDDPDEQVSVRRSTRRRPGPGGRHSKLTSNDFLDTIGDGASQVSTWEGEVSSHWNLYTTVCTTSRLDVMSLPVECVFQASNHKARMKKMELKQKLVFLWSLAWSMQSITRHHV